MHQFELEKNGLYVASISDIDLSDAIACLMDTLKKRGFGGKAAIHTTRSHNIDLYSISFDGGYIHCRIDPKKI